MSKRAAIYARVSTDLQRDNFSIPSQIDAMMAYAKKRGYLIVGDMYVDKVTGRDSSAGNGSIKAFVDDYSSRELNRPALDAALGYLERDGFDVVIVYTLDRLARDPYIRQTLEREFFSRGAKVEYVLGSYEDTPEGEVRKDMDAIFAKWENNVRVERQTRGKRKKAESGKFVAGITPFGYVMDKNAPTGLAVVPEQAAVVQKIFELYAIKGYSMYALLDYLNKQSVKPHYGGNWAKSTLAKLLDNTVYIGFTYYNKHQYINKKLVKRDKAEWIWMETPPLVSKQLYDAAQKRRNEHREIKRRQPNRSYLLTGIVRCEHCRYAYVTQTANAGNNKRKTDAGTYRHRIKQGHCFNRSIVARRLDPIVWEKVVDLLKDPVRLKKGYEESLERHQIETDRQKMMLIEIRAGIAKLEAKKQNLTSAYTDPDIKLSKTEYITQREAIESEIRVALERIEEIDQELSEVATAEEYETLERFASEIRIRLDNPEWEPSKENKRKILDLLHITVWIDRDWNGRITGWFEGNDGFSSNISTCCGFRLRPLRKRV